MSIPINCGHVSRRVDKEWSEDTTMKTLVLLAWTILLFVLVGQIDGQGEVSVWIVRLLVTKMQSSSPGYPYESPDNAKPDKIIGLRHFEDFLRDLEKKIAEWTKQVRDNVVYQPTSAPGEAGSMGGGRQRRQSSGGYEQQQQPDPNRPRPGEWLIVRDIIEGVNYARKQISDIVDRLSRVITGDQQPNNPGYRQGMPDDGTGTRGPYVPVVKELREFLVLLQKRLSVWSTELQRVFVPARASTEVPMLLF